MRMTYSTDLADAQWIHDRLYEYNLSKTGASRQEIKLDAQSGYETFLVRDETPDAIIWGGLVMHVEQSVMKIDFFWLDETLRGQGFGAQLMRKAKREAVVRDLKKLVLFTSSFQAPKFYMSQGMRLVRQSVEAADGVVHYDFEWSVPSVRRMRLDEVDSFLELKDRVGWNHCREVAEFLIANPEGIALFAEQDGRIIGSAGAAVYENALGFINIVIVRDEFRRQGIASLMLNELMRRLKHCRGLRLHATAAGQAVYLPLGFTAEDHVYKYGAEIAEQDFAVSDEVSAMTDEDFDEAAALDRALNGFDRTHLLRSLRNLAPELGLKLLRNKRLAGFVLGRNGSKQRHIAPVIAPDVGGALDLVAAARNLRRDRCVMDVPAHAAEFRQKIGELGFVEQREMLAMKYGTPPNAPAAGYFATLGGEFG